MRLKGRGNFLFQMCLGLFFVGAVPAVYGSEKSEQGLSQYLREVLNPQQPVDPLPLECEKNIPNSAKPERSHPQDERAITEIVGEEAMQVFRQILSTIKKRSSFRDCGLSNAELLAITGFTGDAYYSRINEALRGGDEVQLKKYQPLIRLMVSGLGKLASYHEGVVTRGWRAYHPALQLYQKGALIKELAFTSAKRGQVWPGRVQFALQTSSCKYIAPLSARPAEEEVICLPGMLFRVLHRETAKEPITPGSWSLMEVDRILLQEEPSQNAPLLPRN